MSVWYLNFNKTKFKGFTWNKCSIYGLIYENLIPICKILYVDLHFLAIIYRYNNGFNDIFKLFRQLWTI